MKFMNANIFIARDDNLAGKSSLIRNEELEIRS
jgi:hypothetical protein